METIPEIKPTTATLSGKKETYTLLDKDYLLIKVLRQLTDAIDKLRLKING